MIKTLTLTREDFINAKEYKDIHDCVLATAIKREYLDHEYLAVGGNAFSIRLTNYTFRQYHFPEGLEDEVMKTYNAGTLKDADPDKFPYELPYIIQVLEKELTYV